MHKRLACPFCLFSSLAVQGHFDKGGGAEGTRWLAATAAAATAVSNRGIAAIVLTD